LSEQEQQSETKEKIIMSDVIEGFKSFYCLITQKIWNLFIFTTILCESTIYTTVQGILK
jgi:hypothetical protein